jgi:uncharacterized membrane protein YkvA (DUF1232 family)
MLRPSLRTIVEATMISRLKAWAHNIKRDGHAIYLASRDPRVPWYAKALAIVIAAYALSPIDLIPDFIPVLGYLDELILLPLGIRLVVALIPAEVMAEYRIKAEQAARRPTSRTGMLVIALLWMIGAAALAWAGYALWQRRFET